MLVLVWFLGLFASAANGAAIAACAVNRFAVTDFAVSIHPDPPHPNQKATFKMTGNLVEAVSAATLEATMKLTVLGNDYPIHNITDVTIEPALKQGPFSITFGPFTVISFPLGLTPVVTGMITMKTDKGMMLCVKTDQLPLTSLFNEPEELSSLPPPPVVPHGGSAGRRLEVGSDGTPVATPSPYSFCDKGQKSHISNFKRQGFPKTGMTSYDFDLDEDLITSILNVDLMIQATQFIKIPIKLNAPIAYRPGIPAGHIKITTKPEAPGVMGSDSTGSRVMQLGSDGTEADGTGSSRRLQLGSDGIEAEKITITGQIKLTDQKNEDVFCIALDKEPSE